MPTGKTKVKSSQVAVLLGTGADSYARMGKGITSLPISYGAKTTTETYVDEDNATTDVTGYEVGIDTEQTAIKGDPVFDFIDGIRKEMKTGSEAETAVVIVNLYDMEITSGSGTGKGKKYGASIAISSFDLEGGEVAKIKYKLSLNGDPAEVDVTVANGVVTVTSV